MPRLLKWIIAGVAALLLLLAGLTAAFWYVNRDTPEGALDTDLSRCHGDDRDNSAAATPEARACRRQALLALLRRRPAAHARAARRHARDPRPAAPLDAGARQLHRVSAQLLRRRPLREQLPRDDVRARLRDREGAVAPRQGRHEAVLARDRRAADPRQLARRDRDGARPRDGQGSLAGADRR